MLGEFIDENINISNEPRLSLIFKVRKKRTRRKSYDTLAIFFLTGIDLPDLEKMFGYPLLHDHFGEGFHDEDNIKESFASWFIKLKGVKFHIGVDHRGTTIEVINERNPMIILESLKELVILYKNK